MGTAFPEATPERAAKSGSRARVIYYATSDCGIGMFRIDDGKQERES